MIKYATSLEKNELPSPKKYAPSKVTKLGFASIGDRVKSMIAHGKLVAENLAESGEYDDNLENGDDWKNAPDVDVDPLNDISLDKMDALSMQEDIISRAQETGSNISHKLKEASMKKSDDFVDQESKSTQDDLGAHGDGKAVE